MIFVYSEHDDELEEKSPILELCVFSEDHIARMSPNFFEVFNYFFADLTTEGV